jgi:hypothetical protein
MGITTSKITVSDTSSGTNMIFSEQYRKIITTQFHHGPADATKTYTWPFNVDPGQPLAKDTVQVKDNYIFAATWGNGFQIIEMAGDGTMTQIYEDTDPVSTLEHMSCLAIDYARDVAYVATYNVDALVRYEFSDLIASGGAVVKTHLTAAANNVPEERFGYAYRNGLSCHGDWLYMATSLYSVGQRRWNTQTEASELMSVNYRTSSMRYGELLYEEEYDRLWQYGYNTSNAWVIENPGSSGAEVASEIRVESLGMGDDLYFVGGGTDPDNTDHVWCPGTYRFGKMDAVNVFSGISSTISALGDNHATVLTNYPWWLNITYGMRFGFSKHSSKNFMCLWADRVYVPFNGWWDQENSIPVATPLAGTNYQSNNSFQWTYGQSAKHITTASGLEFWLYHGYTGPTDGLDGEKIHAVPAEGVEPDCLYTSSEITLGPFALDDSANIGLVTVEGMVDNTYVLSGTTLNCYLSNNGESTWEAFDYTDVHAFSSTGNSVYFKMSMTGTQIKSPHINISGDDPFSIIMFSEDYNNRSRKILSTKIKKLSTI